MFKKAGEKRSTKEELDSSGVDSEKSLDIETNDEVYAGHHPSSFIPLFYSSYVSKLKFVELEGEVQFFINSQETTASTGISDFLPQAVSNPVQSDLESSSSQDLRKRSREEEERSHLQF